MTDSLHIDTLPMGPLSTNCYLIYNKHDAVIIDPGDQIRAIDGILDKNGLVPTALLLTHLHFDHTYGVAKLHEEWGLTPRAGAEEEEVVKAGLHKGTPFGIPGPDSFTWTPLAPGEHTFGTLSCIALATPGHSPGSLTYYFPQAKAAFTGDVIFRFGAGRTDFPGGSPHTLAHSIIHSIYSLPPDTVLYPGHGEPTTVQEECAHNPFIRLA